MDGGGCEVAAADVRDFGVVLVGAGRSVDDSRFRFEGVDVDAVLGRGGGGMGVCWARDGVRVEGPATGPAPVAVARCEFALFVVAAVVGVFDPPD